MNPAFALLIADRLVKLSGIDMAIIAFYFGLVLAIGF